MEEKIGVLERLITRIGEYRTDLNNTVKSMRGIGEILSLPINREGLYIGTMYIGTITGILVSGLVVSPQTAYSISQTCQKGVTIEYTDNSAIMKWDKHKITFRITKDAKLEYNIGRTGFKHLSFRDKKDLNKKMGQILDHEVGRRRKKLGACFSEVYETLNLDRYISRSNMLSINGKKVSTNIFEAKEGKYVLSNSGMPLTYLLVRNRNTSSFYCLSLVQELFDMVYGLGEAKRLGLYSDTYAEGLNFIERPAIIEKYYQEKHNNLEKGVVVRYGHDDNTLPSIGFSLGNGMIAHITGEKLYIEKIKHEMAEGWIPTEIITPDKSFKEVNTPPLVFNKDYEREKTLEQIAYDIKKCKGLEGNDAAIEEIIYQLNKPKFRIKQDYSPRYGNFTAAYLKKKTKLLIPEAWVK